MSFSNNSMSAEIHSFIGQAFSNCDITSRYYPEQRAWSFVMRIQTNTNNFSINPPKACCLMRVQAIDKIVEFQIVMYVDDFLKIYGQKSLN